MNELEASIAKMIPNGNRLELPQDCHFDNYPAVKKAMIAAGGKYNKNGFIFPDPVEEIHARLSGGEKIDIKKDFQFFETPKEVADMIHDLAEISSFDIVLEPSAGRGALLEPLHKAKVFCVELMRENVKYLQDNEYLVTEGDFLEMIPEELGKFDRIIANPPFTKNQDIDHVLHMYKFLADGGILVSVMSPSWTFGSQKKQVRFREWLSEINAEVIELDAGAFKESGTMVRSCIVKITKPQ